MKQIVLDGKGPLHQQIERTLRGLIQSGQWPPGFRIPPEHDLVRILGCSRATINKVLSSLANAQLIVRRRRHGSFVNERTDSHAVIGTLDVQAKVEERGLEYSFKVLSSERVSGEAAGLWSAIDPLDECLRMIILHTANGSAEALEERLILIAAVPEVVHETFEELPPNQWLLARLPCTRLVNRIRAVSADHKSARTLGVASGEPLLVSERSAWSGVQPVTWVRLSFPGSRSEFVGEFNPLS